jgi:hypothetical protein
MPDQRSMMSRHLSLQAALRQEFADAAPAATHDYALWIRMLVGNMAQGFARQTREISRQPASASCQCRCELSDSLIPKHLGVTYSFKNIHDYAPIIFGRTLAVMKDVSIFLLSNSREAPCAPARIHGGRGSGFGAIALKAGHLPKRVRAAD